MEEKQQEPNKQLLNEDGSSTEIETTNKKRKLESNSHTVYTLNENTLYSLLLGSNISSLCRFIANTLTTLDNNINYFGLIEHLQQDNTNKKIFIRGLPKDITTEQLKAYFAKYGTISQGDLIKDKNTNMLKGFAFITFDDLHSTYKCLEEPEKKIQINNETFTLHCNLAIEKNTSSSNKPSNITSTNDLNYRKLFVRSLNYNTKKETLYEFFSQYGKVQEAVILQEKGKSKGYGFVTFADVKSANKALKNPIKELEGRSISCKLAIDTQDKGINFGTSTNHPQPMNRRPPPYHDKRGRPPMDMYPPIPPPPGSYSHPPGGYMPHPPPHPHNYPPPPGFPPRPGMEMDYEYDYYMQHQPPPPGGSFYQPPPPPPGIFYDNPIQEQQIY